MKEKRNCPIVQDLLPNYVEKLTKEETNLFIEEHLKECDDCKKILENMQKELKVDVQKRDGREVKYMKKINEEMKKLKLWKKILFFIIGILIIYFIISVYKFNILTKIYQRNNESMNMPNRYYYRETEEEITEYWQKDGIKKMNLNSRRKQKSGSLIMWENTNTGEKYVFWNEPKKMYQEGGYIVSNISSITIDSKILDRVLMSINPTLIIYPTKYNDKNCYTLKMLGIKEIIEKQTGLVLYDNNNIRGAMRYEFNIVTDEDVERPNLSEYELINN